MSPFELADTFENNPTQAYRLTLASGDRVIVADPRKTIVSDICLHLRAVEEIEKNFGKVTIVSIPNIVLVEPIDRSQLRTRTRRPR